MITDREEFIKICGLLAHSDIQLEDCNYITNFIVELGKEIEQKQELRSWLEEEKDYLTKITGQNIPLNDGFEFCSMNELYQTGKYSGLKDTLDKLNEIEGGKNE